MAKPIKQRPLHDYEYETIRMVASGATNSQVAVAFDVSVETVRSRMHVIHQLIGTATGDSNDNVARTRMVIWAYDHDLVQPVGVKPPPPPRETPPAERIPAELAAPMIRLSLDILADQPRGDLRRWAARVVEAAGLKAVAGVRRGRPVAVADDEQAAA